MYYTNIICKIGNSEEFNGAIKKILIEFCLNGCKNKDILC